MTCRWCKVSALKALEGDADGDGADPGVDGRRWIRTSRSLSVIPEKPFLMPIEDVFTITGRGTVVTGRVEQGIIHTGDEIEIVGIKPTQKTTCTGVEMFRKLLDEGRAGDNIGALLRGTKKEEVERGQVLAKPGSHHAAHRVRGSGVCVDQGGGRASQAVLRELPAAVLLPDDGCDRSRSRCRRAPRCACRVTTRSMTVELINPIAMEEGLRFAIREGGRTVGAGRVTKIIK